ncbi:restin homolog isoform X3 [Eurosta solidaginis]|uniref:restin homolog isoform X3 n=2 Tax=Eurosta solidaginis TaxID=178769 RepID=UPI003530ABF5
MSDKNSAEAMPPPALPAPETDPPADGVALSLEHKPASVIESTSKNTTSNTTAKSTTSTPASSVTGGPTSRLRAPTNYSGDVAGGGSKIGRICCSHVTPKAGPPPRDTKSMSRESDDNLSSINSAYADHGAVLTQDTEQFIIGQKVWVGGIRPGQIAYIGETHFAPGDWAGIVLDEPNGKNDGCVAGKRYFQCEPKRGIFSRLTRLTLTPLSGAHTPTSPFGKMSPDRSRTVSPTASVRSSFLRSPGKNGLTVGDRVIVSSGFGSRPGILRYLGETQFAVGNWCGVELDEPSGKNDGSVDGVKYFECKPKYGVFVPIAKVSLSPSSKKSRLSRAGSRESLTSIGTMNSIATTNMSRLRMSAQRKPLSIKPIVATPKSQYSMQDVLHEKQKHIEQLMIERELDREDCQNQALQYQKNVNELKSRITQLERSLDDERKKSEDLQFSLDEATYCGNDANNHVYKEKIQDLEKKISQLTIENTSASAPSTDDIKAAVTTATETATAKITELTLQLQKQRTEYETRLASVEEEQKRLQENIEYLRTENESLQKELVEKDENLEKFTLSACGIQNLQHEIDLIKEETEKERKQLEVDFLLKLEEKDTLLNALRAELTDQKNIVATLEGERSNIEDECDILRSECKTRDVQVQDINGQLAKLTAELSMQKAENATLEELLKAQQTGTVQGKTQLEQKLLEIEKLKDEITDLKSTKKLAEDQLKTSIEEVKKLTELQKNLENKIKAATSAEEDKVKAMSQMGMIMEELKKQITENTVEKENLRVELKKAQESHSVALAKEAELRNLLQEQERTYNETLTEINKVNTNLEESLKHEQQKTQISLKEKAKEAEALNAEVIQLRRRVKSLECDSSASVQQLSARISQLESQAKTLHDDVEIKKNKLKMQTEGFAQQERILAEKTEALLSTSNALEVTSNLTNKLKLELETAFAKCAVLEATNKTQAEHCAQQQLEIGDLSRKLESLNTKCDNLNSQNEVLEHDLRSTRSTITTLQTEVRRLNEDLALRQKNLLEIQTTNNDERLKLEGQLEELSQKLDVASRDLEEQKANTERARNEVTKKNVELAGLDQKAIKLELALSDKERQYENLQAKYESLVAQNKTLEGDLITLRTTSTDSNAELSKITQQVAVKQKAYDELLDKTNIERSTLENQLQASQQRIDALCNQVETLTQELKSATEESFKRVEILKQEQEKSGKQELELSDLARKLEALAAKCVGLENENANLQKDLIKLRSSSTASSAVVTQLNEDLTQKQKLLQDFTDKADAERLQLANQLQDVQQRLEASLLDAEHLRGELQVTNEAKIVQSKEFESLRLEIYAQSSSQLNDLKEREAAERKKLVEDFEAQLRGAEQTKGKLDDAISSLQQQIQLLQDELLKSQLDFKSKEEELSKQITNLNNESEKLRETLQETQSSGSSSLNNMKAEKEDLQKRIDSLLSALRTKEDELLINRGETEQLKLAHSNTLQGQRAKLQEQIKTLQNALDLAQNEVEYRTKLANEDKVKIEELRNMIETVQAVNAQISTTNAEMSEALHALEQEKCDTANIFELFEMEADQNIQKLGEKLVDMKQQLAQAQAQLQQQLMNLNEKEIALETVSAKFEASQTALATVQSTLMDNTTKLNELNTANAELKKLVEEKENALQQQAELQSQLAEYKNVIDEMDETTTAKAEELQHLRERIKLFDQENLENVEALNKLQGENASLQRKLEVLGLEKTREIVALQSQINHLQVVNKLKHNSNAGGTNEPKEGDESEDNIAQINFLNSIIADMQKKNDTLKAKIEALETLPTDYTQPKAFDLIAKRKPAPRMFCDICDEFDRHETEDCPLQASDDRDYSPAPPLTDPLTKKERKLPEPRKYCETCEVFDHETGECDDDEW